MGLGRINNAAARRLTYPSPFFDVAGTYFPQSIRELFYWCRIYYYTNPIIHAGINKVAVYPLTDIDYQDADESLVERWKDIFENILDYRKFQVGVAISTQVYGNELVSINFPFVKKLICNHCGHSEPVKTADYRFRNGHFYLKRCRRCGMSGKAKVVDENTKSLDALSLIRWNVEDIDTEYNPLSGDTEYYYRIPEPIANDIKTGKRVMVENTRQVFIDAVREQKAVILNKDNLFHIKRTTLASELGGWGIPRLLPVLRDAFGMQLLRKSQEMIAIEHAVPLRIIHPAPLADAATSPYASMNLSRWRENIGEELQKWKQDQNYIPITNFPVGYQELGGQGKALMLAPEIRANAELLLAGMEIPTEFLFGGVSWSGSNVSLRMTENTMLGDMRPQRALLRWVVKKISQYFDIPEIDVKFKPFKMADDLQRMAFNLQLAQAGKLSDYTLLSQADLNPTEEFERIKKDATRRSEMAKDAAKAQALAQAEAQQMVMQMQTREQNKMMREQGQLQNQMGAAQMQMQMQAQSGQPVQVPDTLHSREQGVVEQQTQSPAVNAGEVLEQEQQVPAPVEQIVATLQSVDSNTAKELLRRLKESNTGIFQQVLQSLRQQHQSETQVDARSLPEQRPPRRATPAI